MEQQYVTRQLPVTPGPAFDALHARDIGKVAIPLLRDLLPEHWSVAEEPVAPGARFDRTLVVAPPRGPAARFAVEIKTRVAPYDIDRLVHMSTELASDQQLLVITSYVSPRSRQLFKQRNISYLDATGNAWLSAASLLVDRAGSDKQPKRDRERLPRTSLRGPVTGRVVRLFCDMRPPLKVRTIATETDTHPGNVSRILRFLEQERIVQRSSSGAVSSVDWVVLIERWAADLQKDRRAESFLQPHGLGVVTNHLSNWSLPYAITGPFASAQLAPTAAPLAVDIYVTDIEEARTALSLRRSERIGNVRLIEAYDPVAFDRALTSENGLILANPSQIAADLLTLPTRSADEYTEFVEWMRRHESIWRH
jgi:hypothetical protein